ncbi:aerotaxis transducer Aer2 [Ferrimonas aestuarii]|uniref:PAS domain-containing protein n=1 Tax=Ferrimonas aestuarii TaxID=2569539 RepID=A0A4U1BW96_9GAMM|nr:aerotaxis transducer Aer2 [Ferrimonas aestuarii]TKB57459.1 PAS domain-containing protein [Ferrimonas aestuarii]
MVRSSFLSKLFSPIKAHSADNKQAQLIAALTSAQTALMTVDRDLKVTFLNDKSVELLKEHEPLFKKHWPGFTASKEYMLENCIDIFHKDPSHQRQLLNNPANLPYKTDIEIDDVVLSLHVTAIRDANGDYVGNSLEWEDVTVQRRKENEIAQLNAAIDQAQTAMVMIDRDLNITYVNQQTVKLFESHKDTFRSVWPQFTPTKEWLNGQCIDQFHRHPEHQRKLLANPANLPFKTDITIGDVKIELNVAAIRDAQGNYVGNTLEWQDVTKLREQENKVSRLVSAVEGMTTNMMMADNDGTILYLNPALKTLLRRRESELQKVFSRFSVDNLVGTNMSLFHKNPAHQQSLIERPDSLPHNAEVTVGPLDFRLTCIAMKDANGEQIGAALQWEDITEQKDGQRQIEKLISAAAQGELTNRIDTSVYSGFMASLGTSVNSLLDSVVEPIRNCIDVMSDVAKGDLSSSMPTNYSGEFGALADAVNTSTGNLRSMVQEIIESATRVTSSSSEISEGNNDLSQRTEEQASSLEETAASMEQLTSTVKQNADNAKRANQLSQDAQVKAKQGGDVVTSAVSAMEEINQASKKIADIIGVIDEIAFQTNLLALNAAVEAARAGEQGRGFAVVAGEVRSLAQRSAGAAKEIKGLINDSVDKVSEGSRLVDESGETLVNIVNSVEKVSDLVAEIDVASQEQSTGISEISRAVAQMDEMTQQNSALVEQAAASSEALADEASKLMQQIEFFSDDHGGSRDIVSPIAAESAPSPKASKSRQRAVPRPLASGGEQWQEF